MTIATLTLLALLVAYVLARDTLRDRSDRDALRRADADNARLHERLDAERSATADLRARLEDTRRAAERSLKGATIAVTTTPDDRTYRGVVAAEHADRLTLRDAFVVTPAGETAIGGLQHVYRDHFAGVQQIEAA